MSTRFNSNRIPISVENQCNWECNLLLISVLWLICMPQAAVSDAITSSRGFERFLVENDLSKNAGFQFVNSCVPEGNLIICENFGFSDLVRFRPKQRDSEVQLNASKTETRIFSVDGENFFAFQISANGPVNRIEKQQYQRHRDKIDPQLLELEYSSETIQEASSAFYFLRYFPKEVEVALVEGLLGVTIHHSSSKDVYLLTQYPRIDTAKVLELLE